MGRTGGGGSHCAAEPDVCRALTGVAEGAVLDHGELQGAGSPWVVVREGKGLARSSERMRPGWGGSEGIRGREQGWNGVWGPALPAAGFCPTLGPVMKGFRFLPCLLSAFRKARSKSDRCQMQPMGRGRLPGPIRRGSKNKKFGGSAPPCHLLGCAFIPIS